MLKPSIGWKRNPQVHWQDPGKREECSGVCVEGAKCLVKNAAVSSDEARLRLSHDGPPAMDKAS